MTDATNKNSLYNSYIKAFRWSSDRLDSNGGIICFVSDGGWIDNNVHAGFRKCLEKEFSSIYVFNTRGNARTQGELRRKEAGNIFGGGSRTPISITLLVKNPTATNKKAKIHYYDIGDYLNREEKLAIVRKYATVSTPQMKWKVLKPNEHGDWINQRNDLFDTFIPIQPEKKFDWESKSFFVLNSMGLGTSRDAWVYNSSKYSLTENMKRTIEFYNIQVREFKKAKAKHPELDVDDFIDRDSMKISWSSSLIPNVKSGKETVFEAKTINIAAYRPFNKQYIYFGDKFIHRRGQFKEIFRQNQNNLIISASVTNTGLDLLMSDCIADIHYTGDTQCFPLYYYEEHTKGSRGLFDTDESGSDYIRRDGVSDFILGRAKKQYGKNVAKEDIFYYVYGFLHSPEYRQTFANDLKKMLPRLPLVDDLRDFWAFSKAGRKLAELHLDYETVPAAPGVMVLYSTGKEAINQGLKNGKMDYLSYRVEKMRFPKKGKKDTIIYNSQITIENIPAKAYEYVVNGKSAIEWVMERYQITVHKDSGIKNDPNDWAKKVGNPKYILDLLLSVINVSIQTVDIVNGLPKVKFE